MMGHDLGDYFRGGHVSGYSDLPHWGLWGLRFAVVTLCMTINWCFPQKRESKAPAVIDDQVVAAVGIGQAERVEG